MAFLDLVLNGIRLSEMCKESQIDPITEAYMEFFDWLHEGVLCSEWSHRPTTKEANEWIWDFGSTASRKLEALREAINNDKSRTLISEGGFGDG